MVTSRLAHLMTFPGRLLGGVEFGHQSNDLTSTGVVRHHELRMRIQAVQIFAVGADAVLLIEIAIGCLAGVVERCDPDRNLITNIKFNIWKQFPNIKFNIWKLFNTPNHGPQQLALI